MTPRLLVVIGLALAPATPAAADCAAGARYSFSYANQAAATLAYGSTYNYTASTTGGATRAFSATIAQNGLSSTQVNATQMPAIGTLITGPDNTRRDLVLGGIFSGRTASLTSGTRTISVTYTFAQPIRDFAVTVHDIDFTANQYRDWLMITGAAGAATYTPVTSSPWGNGNGTGLSRTATNSSVTFGATTSPMAITAEQAIGTGTSDNNSDAGTVSASFAQPVTSVTVRYGNAPLSAGETTTGQQGIGIAAISFCPMPDISVTKVSTPTSAGYDVPGADVIYTLTVSNNGASPVDAGTIVLTDLLPHNVRFRNTLMDATTGLPVSIAAGSSGVSLTAGAVTFSNNGGANWGYSPNPGLDDAVNAVRITAAGAMAGNSTFSVSFIGQIK